VLQERPLSLFFLPLSPTNFFSVPHQQYHPCPSRLVPFWEKHGSKVSSCLQSRTPSSAINSVSSNGELPPQRWLQSILAAMTSTTPTTRRTCKPANNSLFLLNHGCRHPSSALAYIKGTSRERGKMDEHSTDKESTKGRTEERGQGNEKKRQREREQWRS